MRIAPLLGAVALVVLAAAGYAHWSDQRAGRLPDGFAVANGRVEVERVDVATRLSGRVIAVNAREGDSLARGTVVARMDTAELEASRLAAAAAARRAAAAIGRAEAEVAIRAAEAELAEVELRRAVELERRAVGPTADVDRTRARAAVAQANVLGARAAVVEARAAHEAAEAEVARIEATIADMTLTAPVGGRVEYRLVQPGEVLGAGGRVVTLLDLSDVFMTIFLPTSQAGRVALGSPARIVLDAAPGYVIPAEVSFVAAEAQFTPKAVETANEREKLMYRVKVAIDPALLDTYRDYVKAGLTGNAYVRVDATADWPPHLAPRLPPPPAAAAAAGGDGHAVR
ncbi:HlyD family secretion protein [Azospirillum halopraeferens]|uniref:HlyD family secretion protein n=1 Tax=Azospirillum halopraeferens TaxID=34010 RepID=UPI0003F64A05|nr:HlyD family efflux transporter periplasmic adaptor subunit [Azospirillum halopraeferens]